MGWEREAGEGVRGRTFQVSAARRFQKYARRSYASFGSMFHTDGSTSRYMHVCVSEGSATRECKTRTQSDLREEMRSGQRERACRGTYRLGHPARDVYEGVRIVHVDLLPAHAIVYAQEVQEFDRRERRRRQHGLQTCRSAREDVVPARLAVVCGEREVDERADGEHDQQQREVVCAAQLAAPALAVHRGEELRAELLARDDVEHPREVLEEDVAELRGALRGGEVHLNGRADRRGGHTDGRKGERAHEGGELLREAEGAHVEERVVDVRGRLGRTALVILLASVNVARASTDERQGLTRSKL